MQVNTATFHSSVHLDEGRLELPDTRCPLCSSTNRQPEYTLQESPRVTLLKCLDCHAISASRMPSDQALQEYYGGYYDSAETQAGDDQVTFDNPLRLARNIVDVYCSYPFEKRVSILDFGGGDGTISCCVAKLMLEKGVERVDIVVVDYNLETVEVQDSRIQIERKDSLDQVHKDQDLVIASAVIEHYPHPQTLMQDLLRCMKQGSMFYARTPVRPLCFRSLNCLIEWVLRPTSRFLLIFTTLGRLSGRAIFKAGRLMSFSYWPADRRLLKAPYANIL